jgi:hypothetical protein
LRGEDAWAGEGVAVCALCGLRADSPAEGVTDALVWGPEVVMMIVGCFRTWETADGFAWAR